MVIRKGETWGVEVDTPHRLVAATSDADLARILAESRSRDGDGTDVELTITGGDLHRNLGRPAVVGAPTARRVALDLLRCELDGVDVLAVAHVVARRSWWRGAIHAVLNVEHLGSWDVAPRGHPNDGRAEVIEVDGAMTIRERYQAWRRLPSGTHVPHPHVRSAHRTAVEWAFDHPLDVYVDGVRRRRVHELRVTVEPDAYELHV